MRPSVWVSHPVNLAEWLSQSRYLPVELMSESVEELDVELASQHRGEGSAKQPILRPVRARIAAGASSAGLERS